MARLLKWRTFRSRALSFPVLRRIMLHVRCCLHVLVRKRWRH